VQASGGRRAEARNRLSGSFALPFGRPPYSKDSFSFRLNVNESKQPLRAFCTLLPQTPALTSHLLEF
jgi:hypothetical protein